MKIDYWVRFGQETNQVFKSNPNIYDHRPYHSWAIGALGNPYAGIWFIAENPSLTQVERVRDPDGGPPTIEAQWWASRGDKLLREMLVKNGIKLGSIESHGGWYCYITNVIKEADYTKNWREKSQVARYQAAEIWSSLLSWELHNSNPRLVVVMGQQTNKLLKHLSAFGFINLPRTEKITHYAYIGQRAQGKLGPMHPQRIEVYSKEFSQVRAIFDSLE